MSSEAVSWAMTCKTGRPLDKLMLMLIGDVVDMDGCWQLDLAYLAKYSEASKAQMEASLDRLGRKGLLFRAGPIVRLALGVVA